MSRTEQYRETLRTLAEWDAFLLKESGLPGPRANLELMQAAADEGSIDRFEQWLTLDPQRAPTNSPLVFLACCGVIGLGRLIAEGHPEWLTRLRGLACDPRWRIREAVAMALQRVGDADMSLLLKELAPWSEGNWLEKRAAVAALAEPRLLHQAKYADRVLRLLNQITTSVAAATDRRAEDFRVLRQSLGYAWSVVVVARPERGLPLLEKWLAYPDPDVRWIMKENLKKKRLSKIEPAWVMKWQAKL